MKQALGHEKDEVLRHRMVLSSLQIVAALFLNFNISQLTPHRQIFEGSTNPVLAAVL